MGVFIFIINYIYRKDRSMKKETYAPPVINFVEFTEEVTTLSNTNGQRNGTNVLASWLIGG